MEFAFNINAFLPNDICRIDSLLRIQGSVSPSTRNKTVKEQLIQIIDHVGEASAKAQGLPGPITSGQKLLSSDHVIYIMKDPSGMGGKGNIVGFLKIGYKKLFLLDFNGIQNEMLPLCVLDFYIHESRQRMGCGKTLFEFMLQEEGTSPDLLAIDRPSPKFMSFLKKHYNLSAIIPQVNNFTIFDTFFENRPASKTNNLRDSSKSLRYSDPTGFCGLRRKSMQNFNSDVFKEVNLNTDVRNTSAKRLSYPYATGNQGITWMDDNSLQSDFQAQAMRYSRHSSANPLANPVPVLGENSPTCDNSIHKLANLEVSPNQQKPNLSLLHWPEENPTQRISVPIESSPPTGDSPGVLPSRGTDTKTIVKEADKAPQLERHSYSSKTPLASQEKISEVLGAGITEVSDSSKAAISPKQSVVNVPGSTCNQRHRNFTQMQHRRLW